MSIIANAVESFNLVLKLRGGGTNRTEWDFEMLELNADDSGRRTAPIG